MRPSSTRRRRSGGSLSTLSMGRQPLLAQSRGASSAALLAPRRSGASGPRAAAAVAATSADSGCVADAADVTPRVRGVFWAAGDFAFLHVLPLFFYLVRVCCTSWVWSAMSDPYVVLGCAPPVSRM